MRMWLSAEVMGLFRRKKETQLDASQEALAVRIANAMLKAQRRWAEWLNAKASKIGKRKVIVLLVILGLGFGLCCLWLVVGVLF